ncbi:Aste57867_16335 [Aphanomyces stellatus]|uniref:Aste57867_16335 protein n=1 Tax=Aphanomyces stellatus TaxID=120398 RepID=A0A485L5D4_9STRA|nr:hypothetical protein As57867_016278 [Aphanomyces stellatus]VFT93111.1 Aste57867_16335 [Aphanomyces stellatus]
MLGLVGVQADCGTEPSATFGMCSGNPRRVRAAAGAWVGSTTPFLPGGTTDFCKCGFGAGQPTGCNGFICAGGNPDGGGGQCDAAACTSGGYTFDATNGWAIKNSHGGSPWRSFAYLEPCGPDKANACVEELLLSFQLHNVATWPGYIKLLFFGDSANVLGLWPNKGMTLLGFPHGDQPSAWDGEVALQDGAWYDVRVTFAAGVPMELEVVNGDEAALWHPSDPTINAQSRAQLGLYTWAPPGAPEVTLNVRNLCMGKVGKCTFTCGCTIGSLYVPPTTATHWRHRRGVHIESVEPELDYHTPPFGGIWIQSSTDLADMSLA